MNCPQDNITVRLPELKVQVSQTWPHSSVRYRPILRSLSLQTGPFGTLVGKKPNAFSENQQSHYLKYRSHMVFLTLGPRQRAFLEGDNAVQWSLEQDLTGLCRVPDYPAHGPLKDQPAVKAPRVDLALRMTLRWLSLFGNHS